MDSETFKVGNGSQNASEAVYKDILASFGWAPRDTDTQ